jgi:hypothetical protein
MTTKYDAVLRAKRMRRNKQRPVRGPKGLEREPARVVSTSGLSHPIARGRLGRTLAER